MATKNPANISMLEAMAAGILESGADTDTARAALVDAYDSHDWGDEQKALAIIEKTAQAIKYKNKDQSTFGPAIENIAPIPLKNIPMDGITSPQEAYTRWADENTKAILESKNPMYAVAKQQILDDIKTHASEQRRAQFTEQAKDAGGLGTAVSLANRGLQGAASGIEPIVNSVVNSIPTVDDYSLDSSLTEFTSTEDNYYAAAAASGVGSVAGVLTAGALAGKAGVVGYGLVQGTDAVGTRYSDTKKATGSQSQALTAAGVEAVSQGLQLFGEAKVFGGIADRFVQGVSKGTVKEAIQSGLTEAGAESVGQGISNVARNIQTNRPLTENISEGTGTAAVLGGVLAGGAYAGGAYAPGGIRGVNTFKNSANTNARADEVKQFGTPITPQSVQQVGPIVSTNEDVIPGEVEENVDPNKPVIGKALSEVVDDSQPAFTDVKGKVWRLSKTGAFVSEGRLSHDKTVFLSPADFQKVYTATLNGRTVKNTSDGPVLYTDKKTPVEKIAYSSEPVDTYYPLHLSNTRSPSSQKEVTPIRFSNPVKSVNLSMGAAQNTEYIGQKETTLSRKAKLVDHLKDVVGEGVYYDPASRIKNLEILAQQVEDDGIAPILERFKSIPTTSDAAIKNQLGTTITKYFNGKIASAISAGDMKAAEGFGAMYRAFFPEVALHKSETGRALESGKGDPTFDNISLLDNHQKAVDRKAAAIAAEEGVSIEDLVRSDKDIADTNTVIDAQKKIIQETPVDKDAPEGQEPTVVRTAKKRIETEQAKLKKLLKRKEKLDQARLEALKETQMEAEQLSEAYKLQTILDENPDLPPSDRKAIEKKVIELKAASKKAGPDRLNLYGMWAANVINGSITGVVSLVSGTMSAIANPAALVVSDVVEVAKGVATGSLGNTKLQSVAYVKAMLGLDTVARAVTLAKIAATTGRRVGTDLERGDIAVIKRVPRASEEHNQITEDFYQYSKSLKYKSLENVGYNLGVALAKLSGGLSMPFMRVLAASEALVRTMHLGGFDAAAAAAYYNKGVREGVSPEELAKYKYNGKENWKLAEVAAKAKADGLRKAGVEVSKAQEYVSAVEIYEGLSPKEVQLSAFKQATQLVGNGPAQGYLSVVSDCVNMAIDHMGGDKSPAQYLMPFANSVAHFANVKLAWTPYGLIDAIGGSSKRTSFERNFITAQAITGSAATIALIAMLKAQWEKEPNTPQYIDVISKDGGYSYGVQIGDVFVDTKDTPLALIMIGVGKAFDKIKKGEDPDPVNTMLPIYSSFTAMATGGMDSISMLKGISDLGRAVVNAANGTQDSTQALAQALLRPVKGFVPGASALRMVSRLIDNPVVAKKDIMSAVVEGIPGVQSYFGMPALNQFGEVMPSYANNPELALYRVFSTKPADIDMRWLVDNGYSIPQINNMHFSKKLQELVEANDLEGAQKLDYKLKHEVYRASSEMIRATVSRYRQIQGLSAYDPKVQAALNKDIRKILNYYTAKIVKN